MGDSFTEGLEDELGPSGRHLGWADRVAAALATRDGGLRYANLAVRGRLLDQVVDEQLPIALGLSPDLVTFHAGPNDVLRPRADVPAVLTRYDAAVASLRGTGVDTVLFTVIERAGGTGRTAQRLADRFAAFNAGVRDVARRHGALLVDQGAVPSRTGGSGTRTGCTSRPRGTRESPRRCWSGSASTTRLCWAASRGGGRCRSRRAPDRGGGPT